MTNGEINKRVAVLMGAEFKTFHGGVGQDCKTGKPYPVEFPSVRLPGHTKWTAEYPFATDPAAADLVRLEIERRGWLWVVRRGQDGNYWGGSLCGRYAKGLPPRNLCSLPPHGTMPRVHSRLRGGREAGQGGGA